MNHTPGFVRHDVTVPVPGADLAAWWYQPTTQGPWPAVVMAHGFGAVKDMFLDRFAERFPERIAALVDPEATAFLPLQSLKHVNAVFRLHRLRNRSGRKLENRVLHRFRQGAPSDPPHIAAVPG